MVLKVRSLLIAVSLILRTRDCAFTAEKPAMGGSSQNRIRVNFIHTPTFSGGYVTAVHLFCFFSEQAGVIFSG